MELFGLFILILGILLCFLLVVFFFLWFNQEQESAPKKNKTDESGSSQQSTGASASGQQSTDASASNQQSTEPVISSEVVQSSDGTFTEIEYSDIESTDIPTKLEEVNEKLIKKVERILDHIPIMPAASIQIDNILRDPQVTAKQVAVFVSTNPLISSNILRTVNSAFFGLSTKVTSVGRAVTLLGFNNVRSMVIRDTLHSSLPKTQGEDREMSNALWLHSTVVAACAEYLSKKVFLYTEHDLGTIALLHDIGKYFQEFVGSFVGEKVDAPTLVFSRDTEIGHAQLGSMLARHWQLPEAVVKCIEYHHYPTFFPIEDIPEQYIMPAFIICISDLICKTLGYDAGSGKKVFPILYEYYYRVGFSADLTNLVNHELVMEIEKARVSVEAYLEE